MKCQGSGAGTAWKGVSRRKQLRDWRSQGRPGGSCELGWVETRGGAGGSGRGTSIPHLEGSLHTEHSVGARHRPGHCGYQNGKSRVEKSALGGKRAQWLGTWSTTRLPGFESQPRHLLVCGS